MSDTSLKVKALNLKKFLKNWRAIMVSMRSVLLWNKDWHPAAVIALIILFKLICQTRLNIIAIISIVAAKISIINFLMPFIHHHIEPTWSVEQEIIYGQICYDIVNLYYYAIERINFFYNVRMEKPLLFFPITIVMLLTIASISFVVENIVFWVVSIILLSPGISKMLKGYTN